MAATKIKELFRAADTSRDGFISREELQMILSKVTDLDSEEFDILFEGSDRNSDGKLSIDEFIDWCLSAGLEEDTKTVVVCGAGCEEINGKYDSAGEWDGKPMYICADTGMQLWWNTEWRIGRTNDYYYTCQDEVAIGGVWGVARWQANGATCPPAPTLQWNLPFEVPVVTGVESPRIAAEDIEAGSPHVLGWSVNCVHVFIAGFIRFQGDAEATWSDENRFDRRLAEHFVELGVPSSQVVLLMDDEGTVSGAQSALRQLCCAAYPGDLLLVYWGSHGFLPCGAESQMWSTSAFDGSVSGTDLMDIIRACFKGSHLFIAADSCFSGCLPEVAESYAGDELKVFAISSTARGQTAWSSWRFCRCLLRGFKGEATSDGGGAMSLGDFARYARSEMAFYAHGYPECADAGFDTSRIISADSVAKDPDSPIGKRISGKNGRGIITNISGDGEVSVEFCEPEGQDLLDVASTKPFTWRKFDRFQAVEFKWWKWTNWYDATVTDTFEHLYLISFDAHDEHPAAGTIWAPAECIRLPGEGGAGVKISGAGCDCINGVYQIDGEYSGRPVFTCSASGFQLWHNGQWRIGKTNDYYYVCNEDDIVGGMYELASFQANPATAEPAPEVWPTKVAVTGAGCDSVNGVYELDGEWSSKPMYTCKASGFIIWYNHEWRIGKTNDYYYMCKERSALGGSWEVATFQANPETTAPAPSVLMTL